MNSTAPLLLAGALLLSLSARAQATNTGEKVKLQVTLHGGETHTGTLEWEKTYLLVRAGRKLKIPYRDISSISAPPEPERAALEQEYQTREKAVPEQDAKAWVALGRWAREVGLYDEALEAFGAAADLDPSDEEARRGSGLAQDEQGQWVMVGLLIAQRRAKLEPKDYAGRVELARFARSHGQHDLARDLCGQVLLEDPYQEDALRVIRPYTDAYRQRSRLILPISGRWRASEDRTRHHQKKGFAVYALDLNKTDAKGKLSKGRGKRLEDYYAWDAPFYAVAPGTVTEVREGFPDNEVGKIGDRAEKHNGVSIDHGEGEYSWYVHAKKGSIKVKQGDVVKQGQLLGTVGNSGGSAIPHLHFTLVSYRGISVPWEAEGYRIVAPDGTPIRVSKAWPREGWTLEAAAPGGE